MHKMARAAAAIVTGAANGWDAAIATAACLCFDWQTWAAVLTSGKLSGVLLLSLNADSLRLIDVLSVVIAARL